MQNILGGRENKYEGDLYVHPCDARMSLGSSSSEYHFNHYGILRIALQLW